MNLEIQSSDQWIFEKQNKMKLQFDEKISEISEISNLNDNLVKNDEIKIGKNLKIDLLNKI